MGEKEAMELTVALTKFNTELEGSYFCSINKCFSLHVFQSELFAVLQE